MSLSKVVAGGDLRKDVLLYYWYKGTSAITLYRPVMFLYFRAVGLTWTQIAFLEAIGALTTVSSEIPTGYIGDKVGRRNSLIVGTVLITIGLAGIAVANSFLMLGLLYPLWSLGWNFRSGSDSAWLYDRLAESKAKDRFSEIRGRGVAAFRGVGVFAAFIGGYLGSQNLSWPFLAAAILTAAGLPALLALRNTEQHKNRDQPSPRTTILLIREAFFDRRLSFFIAYYFMLFAGVGSVVFMYEQPVVKDLAADLAYQGSAEILLGILYAAISLVSAILSYKTGFIVNRIGLRHWFVVIPIIVAIGLASLIFVPILALPAILLARGVADVTETLAGQYVNDQLGGAGRATILSSMRLVSKLAGIPFQLGSGWIADGPSTTTEVLGMAGAVLLIGSLTLGRWTFARFEPQSMSQAS